MASVCEFVDIVNDKSVTIGDSNQVWETNFNTAGRSNTGIAFLILNVKGLTHTDTNVDVKINDQKIGIIVRYPELTPAEKNNAAEHWHTQMIAMQGSTLRNGVNEIQIAAVTFPGGTPPNVFDNFEIKNVICFFHKST